MINAGDGAGAGYEARDIPPGGAQRGNDDSIGDATARLRGGLNAILTSSRQTLADLFELMSLELKRAGITLGMMIGLGVVALLLVEAGWLFLMAGISIWLISLGVADVVAVIGVALVNLLGAAAIGFWCVKASKDLMMPATCRQLRITTAEVRTEARTA